MWKLGGREGGRTATGEIMGLWVVIVPRSIFGLHLCLTEQHEAAPPHIEATPNMVLTTGITFTVALDSPSIFCFHLCVDCGGLETGYFKVKKSLP